MIVQLLRLWLRSWTSWEYKQRNESIRKRKTIELTLKAIILLYQFRQSSLRGICKQSHKILFYSPSLPMASRSQPTVPSPPATITLQSTSWNCFSPLAGPLSCIKLNTCLGFNKYWNFLKSLDPCLPPLLGLMNTTRGVTPGGGLICNELFIADIDMVEFWRDRRPCLSRTLGLIDVGGIICSFNSPRSHSGGTNWQHLLCNWKKKKFIFI